jgi:hypothetical protein
MHMNRHGLQALARDRNRLQSLLVLHRARTDRDCAFLLPPVLGRARSRPQRSLPVSLLVECSSASTRRTVVPPRSTHHPASRALSRVRGPPPECPRH